MFLDDEVVGVAVEFFEGEDGGVAEDDFVDGGGEGVPDCFGVGAGHLCSRSERLYNNLPSRSIRHCVIFVSYFSAN